MVKAPKPPKNDVGIIRDFDAEQARLHKFAPYRRLESRLLAEGGERVALRYEEDLAKEITKGNMFSLPVKLACGDPISCHANSADLWKSNPNRYKIVVGWGLGDTTDKTDKIWRQHSFILDTKGNKIIETTVPRLKYFGAILTDKQAKKFYEDNV